MGDSTNHWTPAEYEIVRSNTLPEAVRLLPHRTKEAVRFARRKVLPSGRPAAPKWTEAETRRLQKYSHELLSKLARRFKNRTTDAIRYKRAGMAGCLNQLRPWKTTDVTRLKLLWPSASRGELLSTFVGRSWHALQMKAQKKGWHRTKELRTCPNELRDAIRQRSREDGIPMIKLGAQTRCGGYFKTALPKSVDMNKIARAVEFFGGRLVIDWQDE